MKLTASGLLQIENAATAIEKTPARLKHLGARPDTRITVLVPSETPPHTLAAITRALSAGGYRRVIFTKPRHAAVTGTP